MRYIHLVSRGYVLDLEELANATHSFVDKSGYLPDQLKIPHFLLLELYKTLPHNNKLIHCKWEDNTIYFKSHIGYLRVIVTTYDNDVHMGPQNVDVRGSIVIENSEALQAENILLRENGSDDS